MLRAQGVMPVRHVKLTDGWAVRKLLICVRDLDALPGYARELVETLATP